MPHRTDAGERVVLHEGEVLEGPESWAREFAGRLTPVDDDNQPMDIRETDADLALLASATRAHERVGVLKGLAERDPSFADQLKKAEQEAAADQERHAKQSVEIDKLADERRRMVRVIEPSDE